MIVQAVKEKQKKVLKYALFIALTPHEEDRANYKKNRKHCGQNDKIQEW